MTVEALAGVLSGPVAIEEVLDGLAAAPVLAPFAPEAIAAVDAVSRELLGGGAARVHNELAALGFWLRRGSTQALAPGASSVTVGVGRGLAFHVPPTNVDTLAVHGWALGLLAGNRNVIRLSPGAGPAARASVDVLHRVLARPVHEAVRRGTAVVSYGHEPEPTAACSAACDVRLVWGGDATVAALRAVPLRPGAKDLGFGDRSSLAAIDAQAWDVLDDVGRDAAVVRLHRDAYPFDQAACASPRLVVGVGGRVDDLWTRLARLLDARRDEPTPTALHTGKLAFAFGAAIDGPVLRIVRPGAALTVVELASLDGFSREGHPGAGLFFSATVDSLAELAAHVTPRDQTLAVLGFDRTSLAAFAARAPGVDRIVGLGDALGFSSRWDGMDLVHELMRHVALEVAA